MATSGPAANNGRAWRETWWLAAVGFALFVALRQETLHGTDWRWLVLWLDEPGAVHPQHPGYLPPARALRWLLSPLGLDVYSVLCVYSALGGGLAVAGFHRAVLALRGDSTAARCAAVLAMFTPALFHFATVCELHAPFTAVMAWASFGAVRWAKHGAPADALATGALAGAATLLHATGHLLVPCFVGAVWWANRTRTWRWRLAHGGRCALAHAAVWGVLFAAMRAMGHLPASVVGMAALPGDAGAPDSPLAYLLWSLRDVHLATQLAPTVATEWLLPYAPASLLALASLGRARTLRPFGWLWLAALASYLAVTVVMVHAYTDERGAYLLPLLLPAVLLMQESVPRRAWPVLVAVTIVCGMTLRGEPGRLPPDHAFGRAAVLMAREQPTVFFVAAFPEMDGAFLADARLDLIVALAKYDEMRAAGRTAATQDEVAGWLQLQLVEQRQKGARLVVTDRAVQWLTERLPAFGAGWSAFAQQAGAVRLPADAGIAGFVLR
jgi:hypothetical protein